MRLTHDIQTDLYKAFDDFVSSDWKFTAKQAVKEYEARRPKAEITKIERSALEW